jgi:hypothetical protein
MYETHVSSFTTVVEVFVASNLVVVYRICNSKLQRSIVYFTSKKPVKKMCVFHNNKKLFFILFFSTICS